jgi:hypothetical protein
MRFLKPVVAALIPLLVIASVPAEARSRSGRAVTAQAPQPPAATRPAPARPASEPAAAPAPAPAPVATVEPYDANDTRERLRDILRQYPPSVADVLRLDPSMLGNQDYLGTYPALAAYLAQHPEIARNPAFFVGTEHGRSWNDDTPQAAAVQIWRNLVDGIQVFAVILVITGALVWLVKTLVDYRRWLRISRIQSEVHIKLVDRFTSSEELLTYIQTPAGRRFLESSPIPLDVEARPTLSAPVSRILWSIQIGVVLASGGFGLIFVGNRQTSSYTAEPLQAIGSLSIALGLGFVVSAVVAYLISSRLGLLRGLREGSATDTSVSA